MARAGWSSSKFSASKLNHSFSSSGPSRDLPAHADEDVAHLAPCSRESGCRAPALPARRQRRDIDGLGGELRGGLVRDDLGLAGGERLVHPAAGAADELAGCGLLVVGHVAQLRR